MGTATPKTGQISFADLNTGILQAGSTAQLNMNTAGVRMGYGSTAQLSMSDLRGCYGVSASTYLAPGTKYVPPFYRTPEYTHSAAYDAFYIVQGTFGQDDNINFLYVSGAGWDGSNLNRIAIDGGTKTYTAGSPASSYGYVTPNFVPTTTTASFTVGLRFG